MSVEYCGKIIKIIPNAKEQIKLQTGQVEHQRKQLQLEDEIEVVNSSIEGQPACHFQKNENLKSIWTWVSLY